MRIILLVRAALFIRLSLLIGSEPADFPSAISRTFESSVVFGVLNLALSLIAIYCEVTRDVVRCCINWSNTIVSQMYLEYIVLVMYETCDSWREKNSPR